MFYPTPLFPQKYMQAYIQYSVHNNNFKLENNYLEFLLKCIQFGSTNFIVKFLTYVQSLNYNFDYFFIPVQTHFQRKVTCFSTTRKNCFHQQCASGCFAGFQRFQIIIYAYNSSLLIRKFTSFSVNNSFKVVIVHMPVLSIYQCECYFHFLRISGLSFAVIVTFKIVI